MAHIINSHSWVLTPEIITAASLQATKEKLKMVFLSNGAQKDDDEFLFYKDEDRKNPAFVIDRGDL